MTTDSSDIAAESVSARVQLQLQPRPNHPILYVEGLTQLLVGFPNSRVVFHSMAHREMNDSGTQEVRQIACELVMPTSSLVEMATNVIASLAANKSQLEAAQRDWLAKLNSLNASLSVAPEPDVKTPS